MIVSPQALQEAQAILQMGSGAKSGPTFEETIMQGEQKAQQDAYRQQQDLAAKRESKQMELGMKAQEAVMKNEIAMQQSRESNALDFEKHKLTTQMQARQPQYTSGNATAQSAVSNQYDSSQVPRYLGNAV